MKQDIDFNCIKPKANKDKQNNIDEILLDMNTQNSNNSLFAHINALIEMARLFEEKICQIMLGYFISKSKI